MLHFSLYSISNFLEDAGVSVKSIEKARRDKDAVQYATLEKIEFQTKLPGKGQWESFISNRLNKVNFIDFLSRYIVKFGKCWCSVDETSIIVAGGFQEGLKNNAVFINKTGPNVIPELHSNHEEADSRVFFHIANCTFKNILLYSSDTDVQFIPLGLPTLHNLDKNITIQLSMKNNGKQLTENLMKKNT